jgi:hypothetical protein
MSKYKYSGSESQFNNVLRHQSEELAEIEIPNLTSTEASISESEELLLNLGYDKELEKAKNTKNLSGDKKNFFVPSWEHLCAEAEMTVGSDNDLESLFIEEELCTNEQVIRMLNEEYGVLHRLDKYDIAISAVAGLLGAAVDILLVGIPKAGPDGLAAGPLSNFIRKSFDERFPNEEMMRLANSKVSKVPYDAQDNRNTLEYVEGLSAYYHRLLSLGHDPLLGFISGVFDILSGRMTTIDKSGKLVSQVMENYAERTESSIFAAIAKQIIHLKSDITTSMGLPAPLMGLFNFLQFGSIGEEEQKIAEIVQGMYYEGYDFVHFCALSIPAMIVEVVTRIGYAMKRIKEGYTIKESLPVSLNRETHTKLATMLFIGHSTTVAVNAGKIYFTKNPMAINYQQWMAFARYSYKQLKWILIEKPEARGAYVSGKIDCELVELYASIDQTFEEFSKEYIVIFE